MKKEIVYWLGLVFVLYFLLAACSGTTPTPQTEEPKPAESVVTEEPTAESVATEEPTAESVAAEEPTAESMVTEEPTAESVATGEPTAESVATGEPTAESVITEEPKTTGPRTGEIAPDFTLPDNNGDMVHLADELNDNRMVILVFYHAYF